MAAAKTLMGVTAVALAAHLDLTKQRIGQLADEGVLPRLADGSYDLEASRLAYIRWLRSEDRKAVQTAANDRLNSARVEQLELRNEREREALLRHARTEALALIDEFAGPLRSDLLSIPARLTNDLVLRRQLEGQIEEAFGAASKRAAAASQADEGAPSAPVPNRQQRRAARRGAR
ncbi:hypothetical protein ACQVP2_28270 [Methylobacterium aquaticum]|uniref:hypothetical protein n=1 Tax=Methylobacterium aquaticum TaxID=270351 RepID=UPI003D16373B